MSNIKLCDELSISRQELHRIRNTLIQKGLITYEKGSGNQCGTYSIVPFGSQYVTRSVTSHMAQDVTPSGHATLPFVKPNEIKQKESEKTHGAPEGVYGFHENVRLSQAQYQYLTDTFDKPKELIDKLSNHMRSKGKDYPSHYATILEWAAKDGAPKRRVITPPTQQEAGVPMPDYVRAALKKLSL